MDVIIETWKKMVIHEVIEYRFDDWVRQIAFNSKISGGGIPTMQWAGGVVMVQTYFPNTESVVQEELKGILHVASVSFALKEKFENRVVGNNATINLVDVTNNAILTKVAHKLRGMSKYRNSSGSPPRD